MKKGDQIDPFAKFNSTFTVACQRGGAIDYLNAIASYPQQGRITPSVNSAKLINCYVSLARIYGNEKKWSEMEKALITAAELMAAYNDVSCPFDKKIKAIGISQFKENIQLIVKNECPQYKKQQLMAQIYLNLSVIYTTKNSLQVNRAIAAFSRGLRLMMSVLRLNTKYSYTAITQLCHSMDCLRVMKCNPEQEQKIQQLCNKIVNLIQEDPQSRSLFASEGIHFDAQKKQLRLSELSCYSSQIGILFNREDDIYDEKSKWFGASDEQSDEIFKIRKKHKDTIRKFLNDLKESPYKSKNNLFLQSVCRIMLAMLSEYSILDKNHKLVFAGIEKAWKLLLAIDYQGNETCLNELYQQLPRKDISELDTDTLVTYRENYYQAMMLSCLGLSKVFFKKFQYADALMLLEWSNSCYKSCDKQREGIKEYEQQFIKFFKIILERRYKQCKNKTDIDFEWGGYVFEYFEDLSKTALLLMNEQQISNHEKYFHWTNIFGYLNLSENWIESYDQKNALSYLEKADYHYQACDKGMEEVAEYEKQFSALFKNAIQNWAKATKRGRDNLNKLTSLSVRALPLLKNDPAVLEIFDKLFLAQREALHSVDLTDNAKLIGCYVSLARIHYDESNWLEMETALTNAAKLMKPYVEIKILGKREPYLLKKEAQSMLRQEWSHYKKQCFLAKMYLKLSEIYCCGDVLQVDLAIKAYQNGVDLFMKIPQPILNSTYFVENLEIYDSLNALMSIKKSNSKQQSVINSLFEKALELIKQNDHSLLFASEYKYLEEFEKNKRIDREKLFSENRKDVMGLAEKSVEMKGKGYKPDYLGRSRKDYVKQIAEYLNDLKLSQYKSPFNTFLQHECTISLAVLCEYHINNDDRTAAINAMQEARERLLSILPQTNPLYKKLFDQWQLQDASKLSLDEVKAHRDYFYQAIMFAFFNLSQAYFKKQQYNSSTFILLQSNRYYQLCDKETEGAKAYAQQFLPFFTTIMQTLTEHCKNKTDYDYEWGGGRLERLRNLSKTALPLLKDAPASTEVFYQGYALSEFSCMLRKMHENTEEIFDEYGANYMFKMVSDLVTNHRDRLSRPQLNQLMHASILVAKSLFHHCKFSKMGECLKQALPLIRLCADPHRMKRLDVGKYQSLCTQLIKNKTKSAAKARSQGSALLHLVKPIVATDSFAKSYESAIAKPSVAAFEKAIDCYPHHGQVRLDLNTVKLLDCSISLACCHYNKSQLQEMGVALLQTADLLEQIHHNSTTTGIALSVITNGTIDNLKKYSQILIKQNETQLPHPFTALAYLELSTLYAHKNSEQISRAFDCLEIGCAMIKEQQLPSRFYQRNLRLCIKQLMEIPFRVSHQAELEKLKLYIQEVIDFEVQVSATSNRGWMFSNDNPQLQYFKQQLNDVQRMIDSAVKHYSSRIHHTSEEITEDREKWMKDEKYRIEEGRKLIKLLSDLQSAKIKTKNPLLLLQECHVLSAILCEQRFPASITEIKAMITWLQKAGLKLSSIKLEQTDETLKKLCQQLQRINTAQPSKKQLIVYRDCFYQAIMFAYLNLAQSYIDQHQDLDAIRVLGLADQYFQACSKQTATAKQYAKRFIKIFKSIIQMGPQQLEKKKNTYRYYHVIHYFNKICLTALPLLKNDQAALTAFYRLMQMRNLKDRSDYSQLRKIIDELHQNPTMPMDLFVLVDVHSTVTYDALSAIRFSTIHRVYLLQGFALVADRDFPSNQKDRFSKMKTFLLEALPLIKLYADPLEKDTADVKAFKYRCNRLTRVSPSVAERRIVPLLRIQLKLQASVMYCESKMPQHALMALFEALQTYKLKNAQTAMQPDDYKRFVKSALLIGKCKFTSANEWQCLEKCLKTVLSMMTGQADDLKAQQGELSRLIKQATNHPTDSTTQSYLSSLWSSPTKSDDTGIELREYNRGQKTKLLDKTNDEKSKSHLTSYGSMGSK